MQASALPMRKLPQLSNFAMVVKDFCRKEVDFTGEQRAYDQRVPPGLAPGYIPWSQVSCLIPDSDLIRPCVSAKPLICL